MNETYVTVVGNALHSPEWRKTNSGAMVASFRIASTVRRMDRDTGRWIDGNSLRLRVTCWRRLAENVKNSVTSGDPLIVTGRLFTREWEEEDTKVKRIAYELEATSVGHDLSRGRAVFERVRPNTSISAVEDAEADRRIGGEPTEPVPDDQAPTQFNDMSFDAALEGGLPAPPVMAPAAPPAPAGHPADPTQVLHGAGFTTEPLTGSGLPEGAMAEDGLPDEPLAVVGEPAPEAVPQVEPEPEPEFPAGPVPDRPDVPEPGSRGGRRRGLRRSS